MALTKKYIKTTIQTACVKDSTLPNEIKRLVQISSVNDSACEGDLRWSRMTDLDYLIAWAAYKHLIEPTQDRHFVAIRYLIHARDILYNTGGV